MRDTGNWGGTILRLCRQNFLRVRKLNAFLKKFTFQGLNNLNLYKILYTNIKFYHHSSLLSSLPTCFHKLCIVIVIEVKQTKTNLQKYITTPSPHTTLQREPKKVQQKVIFERRLERFVGLSTYWCMLYSVQSTGVAGVAGGAPGSAPEGHGLPVSSHQGPGWRRGYNEALHQPQIPYRGL